MKNTNKILVATFLAALSINCYASDLPDQKITPGATNPNVTQENIHDTICVKGYTKKIRPPVSYTNKLKKQQIREYGYDNTNPADYEEDHLIALSIGGNPTDEHNLWPQPRKSGFAAEHKDELELKLQNMVCNGEIPLAEAQHAMANNWIEAYKKFGGQKYGDKHAKNHIDNDGTASITPDISSFATKTLMSLVHSVLNQIVRSLFSSL